MSPQVPEEQPRERGDHGAVSPVRLRAKDLAAQDRDLVPQYQDLHVLEVPLCASQPNNRSISR